MPELTSWDYGIALIAVLSIGFGLWRGMIRTVFALAAWIAALLALPSLAPVLADAMALSDNAWVAYLLVFLGVLIGVRMLGALIARGVKSAGLAGVDRVLGAALGVVRAAVVVGILVVAAKLTALNESPSWKLAVSRPLLEGMLTAIEPYLPERLSGIRRT